MPPVQGVDNTDSRQTASSLPHASKRQQHRPQSTASPTKTKTAPTSFLSIQQEQQQASAALSRILQKPLVQIQTEETAIRELYEFYRMTQPAGTGEWITITTSDTI
eukprot:jgi/Hompol1/2518/HPOL_000073-RA